MEHSFELDLNYRKKIKELAVLEKKKKILDELFTSEKISQPTYEFLEKKLSGETMELEAQLKSLSDDMTARAQELEKRIGELELSLALLEMHYAAGEIDDKAYENPRKTILLSLEAIKQEIKTLKDSLLEMVSESVENEKLTPNTEITEVSEVTKPEVMEETEVTAAESSTMEGKSTTSTENTETVNEVIVEGTCTESVENEIAQLVDSPSESSS
ncbi:MAG: CdvA-like protein [Candidatus Bathyarchaeia archaeon]